MRALLLLALVTVPTVAGAQPRRERTQDTTSQCIGSGAGGTYIAPFGSSSSSLCAALIQRCTNNGARLGTYYAIPQRVKAPYYVCG